MRACLPAFLLFAIACSPAASAGDGFAWPEGRKAAVSLAYDVELASTMLQAIDGHSARTYTAPCGEVAAMDGSYLGAVAPLFVGIKLIGGAVVDDMATLDPAAVPVAAPVGMSGAQLIALVEEAGRKGTMANFTFHGIGGDHLQVSAQAHEELLAYLAKHRDDYWTAPFVDIMGWVRQQQAKRSD